MRLCPSTSENTKASNAQGKQRSETETKKGTGRNKQASIFESRKGAESRQASQSSHPKEKKTKTTTIAMREWL